MVIGFTDQWVCVSMGLFKVTLVIVYAFAIAVHSFFKMSTESKQINPKMS
jgi:hypothetical protein